MKQKLTRALIDEIRKEMPILSEDENKCVIGGGSLYIIGDHGTITYSGSTPSDKTMIAVGSSLLIANPRMYAFSRLFPLTIIS